MYKEEEISHRDDSRRGLVNRWDVFHKFLDAGRKRNMLTNRIEQNVLHRSYKGDENTKEGFRSEQTALKLSHVILVTWWALLTIIFWPSRFGMGTSSKLPGEADGTGASQWSTLWVVRCHFLPRARNQRVFSQSMAGTFPSSQDSWCDWEQAAHVKSTSFWSLRADPCLIPRKAKSDGQPALSCSSHNSYSKPPLWGGTLQKMGNSIRAGAVCQITRPLVSNPNGSSKSGEETQQHGRKTNSVHRVEILEDNTGIKPEQKRPEQERNRQMIKEFRDWKWVSYKYKETVWHCLQ